jgi:hypothetical protein
MEGAAQRRTLAELRVCHDVTATWQLAILPSAPPY